MKRTLSFLCAIVILCTAALSGCSVFTKAVKEQATAEAQVFTSEDTQAINELIFSDADIELGDDPLAELTSLATGDGVGINTLSPLVTKCDLVVKSTTWNVVVYEITSPNMSNFFDEKYEEIKTADNGTITETILDYSEKADIVTSEIKVEYTKTEDSTVIDYLSREFTDAITGGLVSEYADEYREKHKKELDELMHTPVGDALEYECSDKDGTYTYHIPEILIKRGSVEEINKEIWDTYNQKVEETKKNIAEKISVVTTGISYEWFLNDTTLSLLIKHSAPNDYESYTLYNIELSSGEKLSNEQILEKSGFTDESYRDSAKKALESKHWDLYYKDAYIDLTDADAINSANQCLDKTRSEKNINKCMPYLNDKGELCIIADIYSIAGAEKYPHLINLETFKLSEHYGEKIKPKIDSVSYNIQKRDHSYYDSASGLPLVNVYYEQVVLSGNTDAINSINSLIKSDYYKQVTESGKDYYDTYQGYPIITTEYPFRNTKDAEVTNNSKGIFSICITQDWYMGGVFNRNYYGLTYDLNTGKELSLTDLTEESASSLNSKLKTIVWNQIKNTGVFSDAYNTLNGYSIDEYLFYVEDGQIVLTFPTYTLGPGAAGPTTVKTNIWVN